MGAGGDDISAWLIAASVIDLDHQWLPDVFTQRYCKPGFDCGMGATESVNATRRGHRRTGGIYHFLLAALDSRNSSA